MTLISAGTLTEVPAFSISVLRLSDRQYGTVEHAVTVCCFALNVVSQGISTIYLGNCLHASTSSTHASLSTFHISSVSGRLTSHGRTVGSFRGDLE